MVLTIDIGNTNIVLGGYENGALGFCTRISTDKSLEADQYALELSGILNLYKVAGENIEGAIISSVVPQITDTVARALRMFAGVEPLKLTQELPTGVGVNIDTPSELGADLLAGAIAAKALYPLPAIVIDMGTATRSRPWTSRARQGVSIMPGVFISLDALVNGTSLLKGIANAPVRAIGKTPWKACGQSGVVFGAASMLDGMVERFKPSSARKTLVATGGAAGIVVPHCRTGVQYVLTLILDGLYAVYCRTHAAL
ncbi:MAG: type III pantothenate kinase [Ruthenibacterium lactatiformans]